MKLQVWRLLAVLLISLSAFITLSSCGGGSSSQSGTIIPTPISPPPSISSISPTSAQAGASGLTLTINGNNFISGAMVHWTSAAGLVGFLVTPAASLSQITVTIPAAEIAIPGSVQVSVLTPNVSPTNVSNSVTFTVTPGPPGVTQTVSTAMNGAVVNGANHDPVLSFDGRFVAFSSEATNLVSPSASFPEGYVRDTCLGADPPTATSPSGCTPSTLLFSAVTGGAPNQPSEGNGQGGAIPAIGDQSFSPFINGMIPQGRYIGFLSTATNLAGTPTTFQQVYVRDTCFGISPTPSNPIAVSCTPVTALASATQNGTEPNGPASAFAYASNRSCSVAFVSAGTNLVSGVTTPNEIYLSSCNPNGLSAGFKTSATLVSASGSGIPGDQGGSQPAISSDGRFVAFASNSTNLTATPNNAAQQIYLRDTCGIGATGCTPSTIIISIDNSGMPITGDSQLPSISDDGRFVAFNTQVPLTLGVTNVVSIRDTCNSSSGPVANCTASTTTVSVAADGSAANGPSNASQHAISGDGRFIVFSSSATNLVSGDNPAAQVFVRDTCKSSGGSVSGCTPHNVLISVDRAGTVTGGFGAAISDDGHSAAFQTTIGNIQQILVAATGF